jgi:hypothetical protein
MAYGNSKNALEEENQLLSILLTETMNYAKTLKPGSLGEFIALDWAGSFDKLQRLNGESIADEDGSFRKTFADEVTLLRGFLEVTNGKGFGESWAELFTKDIEIAERLLTED